VAVASGGPYANHLHLAPDRQVIIFYSPDPLPDAKPTLSKH